MQWIRSTTRLAVYLRDGFACVYCGRSGRGESPVPLTLDHLVPRSLGGGNHVSNLATACRSCNCSRRALPLWEFVASLPDIEATRRRVRNAPRRKLPRVQARQLLLATPAWLLAQRSLANTRGHAVGSPGVQAAERFHLPRE